MNQSNGDNAAQPSPRSINFMSLYRKLGLWAQSDASARNESGPQHLVVNGTAGPDVINGTNGRDTINGGKGADTITGRDDNNSLDGGHDDDLVRGGRGATQSAAALDRICWKAAPGRPTSCSATPAVTR